MNYTIDEIKAIVREMLKYGDVIDCICGSDGEDDKEYSFGGDEAIDKLKEFCKK